MDLNWYSKVKEIILTNYKIISILYRKYLKKQIKKIVIIIYN